MLGNIVGDIVGSVYEFHNCRSERFPLFTRQSTFTDDTVLTVAVADVLIHGGGYAQRFKEYYNRFPFCSYGAKFHTWASSAGLEPYHSFGNGSAMRVAPVAYAFDRIGEVLKEAKKSAEVTHN